MFGMEVLEVVIGLLFVYLLLSMLASIVNEIITGTISLRGRFLAKAIIQFIDDDTNKLSVSFFQNPFYKKIRPYSRFKWVRKFKLPSYLGNEGFRKILIDTIVNSSIEENSKAGPVNFEKIKKAIEENLKEGETRQMLLSLIYDAEQTEDKLGTFKRDLENWYGTLMERLGGWYKRRIQLYLFIIGFSIAILFNADTFLIVNRLSDNPEQRQQLVAMAESFQEKVGENGLQGYYEKSIEKRMDSSFVANLKKLGEQDSTRVLELYYKTLQFQEMTEGDIPAIQAVLGLDSVLSLSIPEDTKGFWPIMGWIVQKMLGWTLTALAISLGAPFWFDLLNKIMKVRSSGKVPEQSD